MNFGCATWRIQDELWEMTQNEYEQEEDGNSLVLSSSNKRPQNTSSARRKMWGEDGNDARLLSWPNINE
jgi:hypothetical protein